MRRRAERLARCIGAGQRHVDEPGLALAGIVEQSQPPVPMAEKAQHRRHAVDGVLHAQRNRAPRLDQDFADIHQIPKHAELLGRASLHVAAIGEHLAGEFAFEPPQDPFPPAPAEQRQGRKHLTFNHGQAPGPGEPAGTGPEQVAGLAGEAFQERRGETRRRALADEIGAGDQGGDAAGQDIGAPGEPPPTTGIRDPVEDQRPGHGARGQAAGDPEIPQPAETVEFRKPVPPRFGRRPQRRAALEGQARPRGADAGLHGNGAAGKDEVPLHDGPPAPGVAGPGVDGNEAEPRRNPAGQGSFVGRRGVIEAPHPIAEGTQVARIGAPGDRPVPAERHALARRARGVSRRLARPIRRRRGAVRCWRRRRRRRP